MPAAAVGELLNWPFLGVSIACLRAFARAHEALLVDASTEDVCERVCKPLTETAGDSLAACLVRLGAADPATPLECRSPPAPTIFVSHARKYLFRDLIDAVCEHVSSLHEEERERQYVWLDVVSQYQHWIGDVGRCWHRTEALQLGRCLPAHHGAHRAHVPCSLALASAGATTARVDPVGGVVHFGGARREGRRAISAEGAVAAGGLHGL